MASDQNLQQLTSAQAERQKKLARFNRRTIVLPIVIMGVVIIAIIGLMFWLTLFAGEESVSKWREFSSATADLMLIFAILPMTMLVALLPILAAGWFWYTQENRRPVEKWLQKWLWKTDGFVEKSVKKVDAVGEKAADLSVKYRASATRVEKIVEQGVEAINLDRFSNQK